MALLCDSLAFKTNCRALLTLCAASFSSSLHFATGLTPKLRKVPRYHKKCPMCKAANLQRLRSRTADIFLPPANVVCEGYVFTGVCLTTGGRGVLSQHALQVVSKHALQQVSRGGGVVSQHALQVSRPTPKGEVEGDLAGVGVSRPTSKG